MKRKPRHPSRSETDSNSSEEEGRYNRKRGKGRWLRREMAAVQGTDLMEGGREPTEEEIQLGLRLPNPRKIQEFIEPLKMWQEVRGSGIPS